MILQNQIDKYLAKNAINGCVYKLSYGGKYIIVKGKTLTGSLFFIQNGFSYFNPRKAAKDTLYLHFYNHILETPNGKFRVRILLKSKNAYSLLRREQYEIDKNMYDKSFLNNTVEAYIPKINAFGDAYGWIPMHAVMNFQKYLNSKVRKDLMAKGKKKQQQVLAKSV